MPDPHRHPSKREKEKAQYLCTLNFQNENLYITIWTFKIWYGVARSNVEWEKKAFTWYECNMVGLQGSCRKLMRMDLFICMSIGTCYAPSMSQNWAVLHLMLKCKLYVTWTRGYSCSNSVPHLFLFPHYWWYLWKFFYSTTFKWLIFQSSPKNIYMYMIKRQWIY